MSTYKIHPIVVGLNATDQGIMTYMRGYGQAIHIPIYVFYLEGGDKKILIDTGLEDFIIPEGLEEKLGLKAEYFEDGLARLGVRPEEIDVIIHTHLHNDHCENDALCPRAKVYAQRAEIEFMNSPHPLDHRYDPDYLEGREVVALEGEAEIAPGVRVIPTPATRRAASRSSWTLRVAARCSSPGSAATRKTSPAPDRRYAPECTATPTRPGTP